VSAEILRKAAALMRERAEAATNDGQWFAASGLGGPSVISEDSLGDWLGNIAERTSEHDAQHIASWHPAVALAVADWLDMVADYVDLALDRRRPGWRATVHHAEKVATAYLGSADDLP
jgi:hypothetical protein